LMANDSQTDEPAVSAVLAELSRIARAPMTAAEREHRVKDILGNDLTLEELAKWTAQGDSLAWSRQQAAEHGVNMETWLEAVHLVDLPKSDSVSVLLDRLRRAESVIDILKVGYRPEKTAYGRLIWPGR
jgi:hypothetical protein